MAFVLFVLILVCLLYTSSYEDKRMQRALMQYWLPKNHEIVRKALHLGHREDLIGYGPKCLVRPRRQPKQVKKV